jgi:PAS domain S-box-containing protein
MNEKESPLLVGWKQIAAYLHCAESTARRQAAEKGLPVFRVGGSVRALPADIDRWLAAQPRSESATREGEEPRALILEGDDLPTALSSLGGKAAKYRYALIPLGVEEAEFVRIQELLRSAEEKYQRLVEQVPVWIWETDTAGEFTYSNPRSFEILGYKAGDFAGYTPTDFAVAPEDTERFEESFAAVRENGSIMKGFRCRFAHRDGSRRWLETDAEPASADDGRFAGVRGVSRDVTDAVVAEEELRRHRDRLEELVAERTAELRQVNAGLQREIAERERAEKDLEEQRNRLRTAFTVTPDLVVLLDRDFFYQAVNPAFCHFMGMPEEELLGRTDFDVFPRQLAEVYRRSDEEVINSGELHILDRAIADADGTTRWLQVAKAPIFDAGGEASGLLVSARDITGQKEIEAALRESEDKFRTLAEESPNMIFINQGGRVVYANKESEKVTGYAREEFYEPDFDFRRLVAPESQELIGRNFATHLRGEDVPPYEYELLSKSGEAIDVVITTKLIRYGAGRAILGIATDITERKRSEEALRESEEKYRFLINSADFPIMFYDTDLKLALINRNGAGNLGGKPEDFVGKTPPELFPAMGENIAAQLERVIASGKSEEAEDQMALPSSERWFWSNFHCVRNTSGEKMGVLIMSHDITARRQAERAIKYYAEAIRESEEKYRDLFENANDLIQSVTPDGQFVYVNRAWKEALGYDDTELKELNLVDVIHPDNRDHCAEIFSRVIAGDRADNVEAVFVTKEGGEVIVEGSASCRFEKGEAVSTRGIFRDVTERKRAEEALRESERRYRLLADNVSDVIVTMDLDLRFTYVSPSSGPLLGYSAEELTALTLQKISTPASFETAMKTLAEEIALEAAGNQDLKRSRTVALELIRKDASRVHVEAKAIFLRDPDDRAIGILAVARDITERQKAEGALRASEERLRRIIEIAGEGVWLIDRDGKTTFANEQMAQMLGYDVEEFLAGHLFDFMDKESQALAALYMERRREGIKEQHDFRFRRKDGSAMWALLETAPVFDADGGFEGALAMVTDITTRKQAEERLRTSEERLRALFELSAEAIIVLDPNGTVVDVNRRLTDWLGFEAADVVGINFADVQFAIAEEKEKSGNALRRRVRGEAVPPYELILIAKTGEKRRGRVRGEILRNEKGEPIADLVMITAIDDASFEGNAQ